MINKLVTVFTPTYNRKESLKICYSALLKQSSQNFKWQIIDDGSTDETESLVKNWIDEGLLDIEFIRKKNGGKASAINISLEKSSTLLWLCLDSDDYLLPNAIEIIEKNYKSIEHNDDICGMFSLRANPDGSPMQNISIPKKLKLSTQNNIRYKLSIPPEYLHVFKTEIIRKYPYPIIEGEKYIPLSYIYDQLDEKYKYLIIHDSIMVCEYQLDGITNNKINLIKKNPIGYSLYKEQLIKLAPSYLLKIKSCITYISSSLLSRKNPFRISSYKLLVFLCFPLGLIDYFVRYRFNIKINLESINKARK